MSAIGYNTIVGFWCERATDLLRSAGECGNGQFSKSDATSSQLEGPT
jgi:hypothetical protein